MDDLKVICLESEAFYALVDEVFNRIKNENNIDDDIWISKEKAKKALGISSDTTLQKLRDEAKIRFSQPTKKIIVYDKRSILSFLEQNAKDAF